MEYDVLNRVRTVVASFYNDIDIVTSLRSIHETVFDTLVEVLDRHEIDTSNLKVQHAQIMNISVSGGKVQFGTIVQGAMNKILRLQPGVNK